MNFSFAIYKLGIVALEKAPRGRDSGNDFRYQTGQLIRSCPDYQKNSHVIGLSDYQTKKYDNQNMIMI